MKSLYMQEGGTHLCLGKSPDQSNALSKESPLDKSTVRAVFSTTYFDNVLKSGAQRKEASDNNSGPDMVIRLADAVTHTRT
jgi:hypothetical protein